MLLARRGKTGGNGRRARKEAEVRGCWKEEGEGWNTEGGGDRWTLGKGHRQSKRGQKGEI